MERRMREELEGGDDSALKYYKADRLSKVFDPIIKDRFPLLKNCRFLYTIRTKPRMSDEGRPVAAEARKCSIKERDVYGYDFELNVNKDSWDSLDIKGKIRLAFHELKHCMVLVDEDLEVQRDKAGRIKIYTEAHDVVVRSFKEEIEKFGLNPADVEPTRFLSKEWRKAEKEGKEYMHRIRRYANIVD